MNSGDIIVNIKNVKDIDNISSNTKYINIAIDCVHKEVIDYFLLNGSKYSYSDSIDGRNGFIYASYDMFKNSENIINNIIDNIPCNLSQLEMVRYIYIALGKFLSSDINTMNDKNEIISFNKISTINNVWGAISKGRVGDTVLSKIFMYLCSRLGIKCELISASIKGNTANKVYIDNTFLIVDLYSDIHNIQGGFSTKYFDKYNNDKNMDKKIFYIKDEYMDYYVDNVLKNLGCNNDNVLVDILNLTSNIIDVGNIGSFELYKIYRNIFDMYATGYEISVNNLFISSGFDEREHFTLFGYNDNYYSFNYNKNSFVNIDINILYDNIKNKRIGVYDDEDFEIRVKGVAL